MEHVLRLAEPADFCPSDGRRQLFLQGPTCVLELRQFRQSNQRELHRHSERKQSAADSSQQLELATREQLADIRARICAGMEWVGLRLDAPKNEQLTSRESEISTNDSRLSAFVIPTDEELLIARDTVRVILGEPHPS